MILQYNIIEERGHQDIKNSLSEALLIKMLLFKISLIQLWY